MSEKEPVEIINYEEERKYLLNYFRPKIQEFVTYWLAISVMLFTSEQALVGQTTFKNLFFISNIHLFIVSLIFYLGGTAYIVGRICYWESLINRLFGTINFAKYEGLTNYYNIISDLHE